LRGEGGSGLVAAGHPHHEDKPGDFAVRDFGEGQRDAGEPSQLGAVAGRSGTAEFQNFVDAARLRDAKSAIHFRNAEVIPRQRVIEPPVERPRP
jgi:hypothetical protein